MKGSSPVWGVGEVLKTPHRKKLNMLGNISNGVELALITGTT